MTHWGPSEGARQRLDEVAERARRQAEAPSLRTAVFWRDREVWSFESGEVGRQYRIGSITKTFTAALVLRLRDEGLLDLNDAIGTHLDDTPYAKATIRDLLSHRSGMTAEPAGEWWERTPGKEWAELAVSNAAEVRVFPPAVKYHYSNLGYGLLGQLVSRLRGRDWYDVLHDELLMPLELHETTYQPLDGAAVGTSRNPITGELQREPAHDTRAMAPAGQLWSTTSDLARWAIALAGREPDLISSESVHEMRTAHSADARDQHQGAYGLGLRLRWQPSGTLIGHTGSMPGFLAGLFIHPAHEFSGVLLANCTTGIEPERVIADLLDASGHEGLEYRFKPTLDETAADLVAELEGDWYWGNTTMRLERDFSGFVLGSGSERRRHFRPSGEDRFIGVDGYWDGETLSVVRRPDGSISHLEVVTFILTRSPYDRDAPIPGGAPLPLP